MLNFATMSTTEIKRQIIKKLGSLSRQNLREIHFMVANYIDNKNILWLNLNDAEKYAIEEGLRQLDAGEGIPHEKVMGRIRKKFSK